MGAASLAAPLSSLEAMLSALLGIVVSQGAVLRVGPGLPYARIEEAVAAAAPGDRIEVAAGAYPRTAVRIATPGLTLLAVGRVTLDGKGFDYSGVGVVPRAVFQIEADGVTLRGFEIEGAHNGSHNGAAVRIAAARDATVEECDLHGNDMGVMSNGRDGDPHAGEGQRFVRCHIHHNGDPEEPGQNHNLYLGGTSATLRFCEIDHATTGHDLKSRAHLLRLEHCWLHDAANREADLVDAWDTERPGSDATFLGCVLQKEGASGNHGVVHFGREKGRRDGTLRLDHCTIDSPFSTPVVELDPGTRAEAASLLVHAPNLGPVVRLPETATPSYRWLGDGRWAKASGPFVGAG